MCALGIPGISEGNIQRDNIQRFSKQCTEIPSVTDVEVINAFLQGTTCRNLVHELA